MAHTRLTDLDGGVQPLREIEIPKKFRDRIRTGNALLDEIFGGTETPGLLKGESIIFTGMPGAGKSTLALQASDMILRHAGRNVVYNIGEESAVMLKLAAERIGIPLSEIRVSRFEEVDDIVKFVRDEGVEVLFQDSLQSLRDRDLEGNRLLRSVARKLHKASKDEDMTVIVVGQVVKSGNFAGPQSIVHDLDGWAHLRIDKDTGNRILEMKKHRFGPAGMPFEMALTAHGLELKAAPHLKDDEGGPKSSAAERRLAVAKLIRRKLLEGELISGYCFERLEQDCSGNFWRIMLIKAAEQLKREGFTVLEKKVNGRSHTYVEGAPVELLELEEEEDAL